MNARGFANPKHHPRSRRGVRPLVVAAMFGAGHSLSARRCGIAKQMKPFLRRATCQKISPRHIIEQPESDSVCGALSRMQMILHRSCCTMCGELRNANDVRSRQDQQRSRQGSQGSTRSAHAFLRRLSRILDTVVKLHLLRPLRVTPSTSSTGEASPGDEKFLRGWPRAPASLTLKT